MKVKVLVYEDEQEGGYTAEVPAFPGCITEADTIEELLTNVREAAELWVEAGSERKPDEPPSQIIEIDL